MILFIMKLYARVNIFRLSENLQTSPEIYDRSKLYFLVKTIFFSSFQIEKFSGLIFKQSSLRQKFKIQFYHSYLSLSFYGLLRLRSSVPLYIYIHIYIYKCRRKSCVIDITSANFKKMYFSKYSIKYVVNRLPPFKNLYDHTNRFLKG